MKINQLHTLVNTVTQEVLGDTGLVQEDLSNLVDIGNEIVDSDNVDNYVKKLVNHIGKVVFTNRVYSGSVPSIMMDSWEFGSILEKISADLPVAKENDSWQLTDGTVYEQDTFHQPKVSAKFFNSKVTFEIPMSFTELQVKESFSNAEQLNGFISMIVNSIENSMTIKLDSLVMRTINNMIGETILDDTTGVRAVNLLEMYNTEYTETLTSDKALKDSNFVRYASYVIGLYIDRLSKISTLFNAGGKERFTPSDLLHVVLLSEFEKSSATFLQSDTFNKELVALPKHETVPYWQGSGTTYNFADTSSINVKLNSDTGSPDRVVNQSGIIGVMFDRDAIGVTNLDRRVTTHYNAKAEFYNNYYKFDAGYYNDLNENFVVFYLGDEAGE